MKDTSAVALFAEGMKLKVENLWNSTAVVFFFGIGLQELKWPGAQTQVAF